MQFSRQYGLYGLSKSTKKNTKKEHKMAKWIISFVGIMVFAIAMNASSLERWQTCQILENKKELKKVGDHFVVVDREQKKQNQRLDSVEGDVSDLQNGQNQLEGEIQDIEIDQKIQNKKIRTNSNDIKTLDKKTRTQGSEISKNRKHIKDNFKALAYTQKSVKENSKQISGIGQSVQQNTTKIGQCTDQLDGVVTKNKEQDKRISSTEETNRHQDARISDNTSRISHLEAEYNSIQSYREQIDENSENIKDLESAMLALSAVDFNPDHEGLSIGFGVSSTGSDSVSGAVGVQYGFGDVDGTSVAVNAKGYVGEGLHHKGVGVGMTIGF